MRDPSPTGSDRRVTSTGSESPYRLRGGKLDVRTSGSVNTVGQLESSDGTVLTTDKNSGNGDNFRVVHDVTAGTYYVRVASENRSDFGVYYLHADLTIIPPVDPGSTRDGALTVAVPANVAEELTNRDRDYYRIDLPSDGRLTLHSSSDIDTVGRLEDATGTRLTTDNDSGKGRNFRISRDVTAGTYYLMVRGRGSSTGRYTLHADFDATDTADGAGRADPERALGHSLAELARDALDQSSTVIERRIEGGGTTRLQAFAGLFGAEGPGEQMRYDNHPEPVSGDRPESYTIGDLRNLVWTQGFAVSPDSTTLDGRPRTVLLGTGRRCRRGRHAVPRHGCPHGRSVDSWRGSRRERRKSGAPRQPRASTDIDTLSLREDPRRRRPDDLEHRRLGKWHAGRSLRSWKRPVQ